MSDEIDKNENQQEDVDITVDSEEATQEEAANTNRASENILELSHGEALEIHETYEITASVRTKLIVLAGSVSSGKTTMITSVYHLLQRGVFAGYMFAGSKTLIGFERRCHPARISSENTTPQTTRTRRSVSDSILHLRLRDQKCQNEIQDLLITDFSGEDYDSINANVQLAQSEFDAIIKRADNLVLLVDGDRISQKKYRHGTKQQSIMLLKTLRDSGLLDASSKIDVIISKYDIVKPRCDDDSTIASFIDGFKTDIESEFRKDFGEIRIYEIAARPNEETEEIGLGYGLEKIIPYWSQSELEQLSDSPPKIKPDGLSEFDLFSIRTLENGDKNEES